LERDNGVVRNVVGTFSALNAYADFDQSVDSEVVSPEKIIRDEVIRIPEKPHTGSPDDTGSRKVGMNFSYTINLNLPETTNTEVFAAIFRALRENLLR
jgi:hypothetical protein